MFTKLISFYLNSGSCPCAQNKTCEDPNQACNCDKIDNKWSSDEGYFSDPSSLGITHMYFLQQKNLDDDSQGRITLGPLECVETSKIEAFNKRFSLQSCTFTDTQKYVVTFTTSQSYIEVPGWRKATSLSHLGQQAKKLFFCSNRPSVPTSLHS